MADVLIQQVDGTCPTSSGNLDFTLTDFGTPKFAIFFVSSPTADNTITDTHKMCIGMSDGTNDSSISWDDRDGQTTNLAFRGHSKTHALYVSDNSSSTVDYTATCSFSNNQVRLTFSVGAAAHKITCIAFGGTDIANVTVGELDDLGNTGGGDSGTITVGHPTHLGFFLNVGHATATPDLATYAIGSFGVVTNGASIKQRRINMVSNYNVGSVQMTTEVANDSVSAQHNTSGDLVYEVTVDTFTATGFDWNTSAAAGSDIMQYAAIEFTNSPDFDLQDVTIPTSGDHAASSFGFTPIYGMMAFSTTVSGMNSITKITNNDMTFVSFTADDCASYSMCSDEDGSKADTKSYKSTSIVLLDPDGLTEVAMPKPTFDSNGWDSTPTTHPAAIVYGWALGIGAGGGGHTVTPGAGTLTLSGLAPTAATTEHRDITPATGSLALSGLVPTVNTTTGADVEKTPGAGTLTLTGLAPTVDTTANHDITPATGTLTLTGEAPAVSLGDSKVVQPDAGALTLSGLAPTVATTANIDVTPDAGALTLTGLVPTIDTTVTTGIEKTPGAGALTLSGLVPTTSMTENVVVFPGTGTLTLTGLAPVLPVGLMPDTGVLTLTGYAPMVNFQPGRVAKIDGIPTIVGQQEYKDLTAAISSARIPPASAPTWTNFGPTTTPQIQQLAFAVNDYVQIEPFHVNHDIVPTTCKAYFHIHWSTDGVDTGNVRWEVVLIRALGHQQAAFATVGTFYLEQAASGTAWYHHIVEASEAQVLTLTEPDELLIPIVRRVAATSDENTDTVFGLTVDFHYQSDREGTPGKAPDFYVG